VASALNALYKAAGKTRSLTLAVFADEGFTAYGPFGTATAWRNAVRDALSKSNEAAPPISSSRLYSIVSAPTAAFGEDWSSVVFVGTLPELPPDVRDYASAWLTPRFCGQKSRLSYRNPDSPAADSWAEAAWRRRDSPTPRWRRSATPTGAVERSRPDSVRITAQVGARVGAACRKQPQAARWIARGHPGTSLANP
jgi:hypothetical protein